MSVRQHKQLITAAAGLLGALSAGTVAWALVSPVSVEVAAFASDIPAAARPASRQTREADAAAERASLAEVRRLCGIDLRRPLYDKPTPESGNNADAAAKPKKPLAVRLMGTAVEAGRSMALLRDKDGSIKVCGEGESFDHAARAVTVTQIGPERVIVKYAGDVHELLVPVEQRKANQ